MGAAGDDAQVRSLLESRLSQTRACPHCDGTRVVRNGSANGLDVAATTAFRGRHRFLQLAQALKAQAPTGVVEADETFFLRSSNGQRSGLKPRIQSDAILCTNGSTAMAAAAHELGVLPPAPNHGHHES